MTPKTTFQSLGIPFPLFEAPIESAAEYHGLQTCSICQTPQQHCFTLGIGADVVVPCPVCGSENALDAHDREETTCWECKSEILFPLSPEGELYTCYQCLRAGKAALTKDTELGMIRWIDAVNGITHGVPGLNNSEFELVVKAVESDPYEGEEIWMGAKLPQEDMLELLRTPTYTTWQGELWHFHCEKPMIYVGEWSKEDFKAQALDGNGERFLHSILQDGFEGIWEYVGNSVSVGVYVFRCQQCGKFKVHYDFD